jgi:hypothetical protein
MINMKNTKTSQQRKSYRERTQLKMEEEDEKSLPPCAIILKINLISHDISFIYIFIST